MKTPTLTDEETPMPRPQVAQVRKLEDALRTACLVSAVCLAALFLVGYAWVSFNILRPWLGAGANWFDALFMAGAVPAAMLLKNRMYAFLMRHP